MIVLANTTDTVEVVLNAAHTTTALNVVSSWRDITATGYTPGRTLVNTNGTTPVIAAGAPAASTQRVIDYIGIWNSDTTNKVVTVIYDASGSNFILFSASIGPGERVTYQEGIGWQTFNSAGALKTIITGTNNISSAGFSTNVLGSNVINNNATANTMQDVTGLSFPVVSGIRYWFRFFIAYDAAATTTGSRWAINGPTFSSLIYDARYCLTSTTDTLATAVTYDQPATSNASSAFTTGNKAAIEGIIVPTADGNVIARFASEVASSAITARAGSFVQYAQL